MKSYFLAPIASSNAAVTALDSILPGQSEPWLLKDITGDAIAYFSLAEAESMSGKRTIQADISGRHYDKDDAVISVLEKLREKLGGNIIDGR
jgi:hypothetical protein